MILLWSLWNFRNKCKHDSSLPKPSKEQISNSISRYISEIKEGAITYQLKSLDLRGENHLSQGAWNPPPLKCWKLNSDASWNDKDKRSGLGWIVRDSGRSLICAVIVSSKD